MNLKMLRPSTDQLMILAENKCKSHFFIEEQAENCCIDSQDRCAQERSNRHQEKQGQEKESNEEESKEEQESKVDMEKEETNRKPDIQGCKWEKQITGVPIMAQKECG